MVVPVAGREDAARAALDAAEPSMIEAVRAAMRRYLQVAGQAVLQSDTAAVVADAGEGERPNLDAWPPRASWDAVVAEHIAPVSAAAWRAGWLEQLGATQAEAVSDTAYLQQHLADTTARLTGATWPDDVYEAVRAAVVNAMAADQTLTELRSQIREVLQLSAWDGRAATIARTEVHAAYAAGTYSAGLARAEVFGEELAKQWLATHDARCRTAHVIANGAVADANESFRVGGEALRFPHDPLASAANTVNCRCVLLWLDTEEADAAREAYRQYVQVITEEGADVTTAAATLAQGDEGAAGRGGRTGDLAGQPTWWMGPLLALEHRTGDSSLIQRVVGIPEDGYRATNHPWLSYQKASAGGHEGKITVGRPDVLWVADSELDGGQVPHLWGAGSFDAADGEAMEVARKIGDGYAGTVSADLDDAQGEIRWLDEDGKQVDEPDEDEFWSWLDGEDIGKDPIEYYGKWRFAGATLVQDPAFHTGWVQITEQPPQELGGTSPVWTRELPEAMAASAAPVAASAVGPHSTPVVGDDERAHRHHSGLRVVTAAAVAGVDPILGSAAWCELVAQRARSESPSRDCFQDPQLRGLTKVTLSADGRRVFGHLAAWDSVHQVYGCPPPPCPYSGAYPAFHRHPVVTAEGVVVLTGPLTCNGHASTDEQVTMAAAQLHYDDPRFVLVDAVVGADEFGVWASGALRCGVDAAGVMFVHRYSFSGDWRNESLIAACACSTPAFTVPYDAEVAALVAAAGPQRPRVVRARTGLRRHSDGSLAALVASGVVGGPRRTRPAGTLGAPDGWTLYRQMQAAAAVDQRLAAAAGRIRGR